MREGFLCWSPKIEGGWPEATAEAERSDLLGNAGLTERSRSEAVGKRTDFEPSADSRTGHLRIITDNILTTGPS